MEEEEVIKKEANRLKKQEIQLILDSPVTDTKYERESVLLQNKMEVIQAKRKHKVNKCTNRLSTARGTDTLQLGRHVHVHVLFDCEMT